MSELNTVDSKDDRLKCGRNSTVEIARIAAIFGIIMMHSTGTFFSSVSPGINCMQLVLINNIGQIGVTLFALISGYYGIYHAKRRIVGIHQRIFFYSILSFIGMSIVNPEYITVLNVVKAVFPVAGRTYWYAACYFFLLFLVPFLNEMIGNMADLSIKIFTMILIAILSIFPTLFFFLPDPMQDGGKGLAWMILGYIVGGDIRRFDIPAKISAGKLWSCLLITQFILFVGNAALSYLRGTFYAPLAKDCSVFILLSASCILMICLKKKTNNKIINQLARNVFTVYLTEGMVRTVIIHVTGFFVQDDGRMLADDFLMSFLTLCICIMLGMLINGIFGKIGIRLINAKCKMFQSLFDHIMKRINDSDLKVRRG